MTQADKIASLCKAVDRLCETVASYHDCVDRLAGMHEALCMNQARVAALTNAAVTTHLAGIKGKDALEHASNLFELNLDVLVGNSAVTKEMLTQVIGSKAK